MADSPTISENTCNGRAPTDRKILNVFNAGKDAKLHNDNMRKFFHS
jgi:hypothetical protein